MRWAHQLVRLANFEVETLQKRLADVVERRAMAELKLTVLAAEGEAELQHARNNAEAGWYLAGFNQGLKLRKAAAQTAIDQLAAEESGARDALTGAFETLKKYETVAETARVAGVKETARRESASLDELGLRQAVGRR